MSGFAEKFFPQRQPVDMRLSSADLGGAVTELTPRPDQLNYDQKKLSKRDREQVRAVAAAFLKTPLTPEQKDLTTPDAFLRRKYAGVMSLTQHQLDDLTLRGPQDLRAAVENADYFKAIQLLNFIESPDMYTLAEGQNFSALLSLIKEMRARLYERLSNFVKNDEARKYWLAEAIKAHIEANLPSSRTRVRELRDRI